MPEKRNTTRGRTVQLGEVAAAARSGKPTSILRHFVFEGDKAILPENLSHLRRMAGDRLYHAAHLSRKAEESLLHATVWLQRLHDEDQALLDSTLAGGHGSVLQSGIEANAARLRALRTIAKEVSSDRNRRVREIAELERDLEREAQRQQRAKKLASAKKRRSARKAGEAEAPAAPALVLDPELLRGASQALTLDRAALNAKPGKGKTTAKPRKKHTGT